MYTLMWAFSLLFFVPFGFSLLFCPLRIGLEVYLWSGRNENLDLCYRMFYMFSVMF